MTTIILKKTTFSSENDAFNKTQEYINEFLSLLPEWAPSGDVEELISPSAVLGEILSILQGSGGRLGRFFTLLMLSVIIAYLASVYEGKLSPTTLSAVCVISLSPAIYELFILAAEVAEGLSKICLFFSSVIPLLLSVIIAGGGSSASLTVGMQMSLVASAVQAIADEILLPMVVAVLILGGISSMGGGGAERLISIFRLILTKGMGLASTVVCALFSLQSVIATASDSATLRLAKFTAQSLAPSVGTVIGASMSAISSGLAYARGVIGAGAIGAILWIMISPLTAILIYRLALGLCLGFSDALGVKPMSRSLLTMQYALDGLLSIFLISGVMFLLELIIFIKCGVEI